MNVTSTMDVKKIKRVSILVFGKVLTFLHSLSLSNIPLRTAACFPWQKQTPERKARNFISNNSSSAQQLSDCLLEVRRFPAKWAKRGLSHSSPKNMWSPLKYFPAWYQSESGHRNAYCALWMSLMSIMQNRMSADGPFLNWKEKYLVFFIILKSIK